MSNAATLPVPALVVEVNGKYVARAFHQDGTYTDSIPMSRDGAARVVKALAAR
jgi:hypothetical protein